jgi:hypothetical protein
MRPDGNIRSLSLVVTSGEIEMRDSITLQRLGCVKASAAAAQLVPAVEMNWSTP